ncbi:MAG: YraN family protein [Gemmatimonadota bacterium]|nr:YraN family protein [Gemmatimonadota bacterium]
MRACRLSRPADRSGRTPDRADLGRLGERLAVAYLERRGYHVLERNWRVGRYELDLVAESGGTVVFVEVKTRTRGPQPAAHALSAPQRQHIRRAAEAWIHEHPGIGQEFRFDLVAVDADGFQGPDIDHIEDAFFGEHSI